jgi:hypothetical protein
MSEPRFRIAQLLCPQRHCVIGCGYDSPEGGPLPEYPNEMLDAYKRMGGEWVCGICGSHDLFVEDLPSHFKTKAEAWPHLKRAEAEQLLTRARIDEQKRAQRN